MTPYLDHLKNAHSHTNSLLCVGLDPDAQRYPATLANDPDRVFTFCREIVDATAPYCAAFKPQIAYFAAQRAESALERLCQHIRSKHPKHALVLDAKRGDIGATAKQYAIEAYERYAAHAVTVNPYMGSDSIEPYLDSPAHGVYLLCRTSNAGGSDLQFLNVGEDKLFERVARKAAGEWNRNGQVGLVVGATFPAELARVRALASTQPLLVPGIGAQGGDIEATVKAGRSADGTGMLINSSRAILYASSGADFAAAAARAAQDTHEAINRARAA
ncbi:orotidine 5'-phosphate decarboxylase [beta proteobacterium AAP99]|nr:orotidine 5'-phosphate decarboxylase [beta proteobacterium AAP99]